MKIGKWIFAAVALAAAIALVGCPSPTRIGTGDPSGDNGGTNAGTNGGTNGPNGPAITAISPANITLPPGATETFTATTANPAGAPVTWSVAAGAGGTLGGSAFGTGAASNVLTIGATADGLLVVTATITGSTPPVTSTTNVTVDPDAPYLQATPSAVDIDYDETPGAVFTVSLSGGNLGAAASVDVATITATGTGATFVTLGGGPFVIDANGDLAATNLTLTLTAAGNARIGSGDSYIVTLPADAIGDSPAINITLNFEEEVCSCDGIFMVGCTCATCACVPLGTPQANLNDFDGLMNSGSPTFRNLSALPGPGIIAVTGRAAGHYGVQLQTANASGSPDPWELAIDGTTWYRLTVTGRALVGQQAQLAETSGSFLDTDTITGTAGEVGSFSLEFDIEGDDLLDYGIVIRLLAADEPFIIDTIVFASLTGVAGSPVDTTYIDLP